MIKMSLADRREMIGRLTLELTQKRGPLNERELLRLRSLQREMDRIEEDILHDQVFKRERAFERSLVVDFASLRPEEKTLITEMRDREQRDMFAMGAGTGAASGAGVFVPVGFQERITAALKSYGPLFQLATTFDTPRGNSYPWPTVNDTTVSGELIDENQQSSQTDVAAPAQTLFGAYKFSSKIIRVSIEFAQDQGVDFPSWLADQLAIRIERAASPYFTTGLGSGSNQPQGIFTAGTNAGVAQGSLTNDGVGGPNTIGTDDVANLELALDPAYRRNASFLCHPNTVNALRKVKNKQGTPVFPEINDQKLFGYPLYTSPFCDQLQSQASSPQTTARPLLFGDLSKYVIRKVTPTLLVLRNRFIDLGELAYVLFVRMDGQLVDGNGGASCQYLTTVY